MASLTTQQISIGYLTDHIRKLWPRLTKVESETAENSEAIDGLREEAQAVADDIATLKTMSDMQAAESAAYGQRLDDLTKRTQLLEAQLEARERDIGDLAKKVRGEQIKRGKAAARAERAEKMAAGQRNRTRR